MNLVRFDPLSLMRDFDRFFDSKAFSASLAETETTDWLPRIDVSERDSGMIVRVEIPGVDPKDVDITLDDKLLVIEGTKSLTTEDDGDGYQRREIFEGSFRRSIRLPFSADPEAISASASNGILEITVPKVEEPAPHRISVSVD